MGIGDKQQPFVPSYRPIRCDVTGKMFAPCAVRSCPHPAVISKYGTGGVANVCIYVCLKCQYAKTYPYYGGVSCEYKQL